MNSMSLPPDGSIHPSDLPPMPESSTIDFTALEPAIASACAQHENENGNDYGNYRRCLLFRGYFVKFDDYSVFYPEVTTLKYLSDLAKNDPSAPRVPQVLHFFHDNKKMAYAVMEYIDLCQVSNETLAVKTAQAVCWMRSIPAPPGVVLGPMGNGRARHAVFKDRKAPLQFVSLGALERYLNKAAAIIRRWRPSIADVSIANEPLVLTQSDMGIANFGVDTAGRPVVFDFAEIGWLPESLALYTLLATSFAKKVAAHVFGVHQGPLHLSAHPNLDSIARVRALLGMTFPLSLDNNGYEIKL